VPWEVVGTDDTEFTLDVPGYGATVASPLFVSFARPTDRVVIVAASVGGHVATLERFTVTGVHV
jgi:hypothetical protein